MTATLKQINVSYSLHEDRIAVKFLDSNMLEVCAWLTYSVTAAFLPHMSKVLGVEYGIPGPAAVDTQTVSHPEQSTEKGHAACSSKKKQQRWPRSQRLIWEIIIKARKAKNC